MINGKIRCVPLNILSSVVLTVSNLIQYHRTNCNREEPSPLTREEEKLSPVSSLVFCKLSSLETGDGSDWYFVSSGDGSFFRFIYFLLFETSLCCGLFIGSCCSHWSGLFVLGPCFAVRLVVSLLV